MVLRKNSSCIHDHHVDNVRLDLHWFARIFCHAFHAYGQLLHLLSDDGTCPSTADKTTRISIKNRRLRAIADPMHFDQKNKVLSDGTWQELGQ